MQVGERSIMHIDLGKYSGFTDKTIASLTLLSDQGYSNQNYTFQNDNTTYVLRKFILQDRDRELEYKIQSLAYEKNIAAKPLVLDLDNGLMICEFLKGEHKQTLSKDELKEIVKVLKKLHTVKIDSKTIALENLFSIQNEEVKEAFVALEKYPKELVLCHGDLNPKNILFSNDGSKLIDWEFAGNNDLYFDLAAISVEFKLSVVDEDYLLASYFLIDGWKKEKLEAYKTIYTALCKQWFEENI